MSDIIVKFKPQGQEGLIRAIKALEDAKGRYRKTTDDTNKSLGLFDTTTKRNAKSMSNLGLAFSTVRSKMLLFNFAMGLGITQLTKMAEASAKLESMERAFNNLTKGSGSATIAIEKLRKATDNTVSDFDLFQQANNAMILGVSKNSDEMAKLFDMAQRLGRAMGVDTRRSVESLITGIGRQSRLMLDNLGIIVSAEQAYKKYAEENNLVASALTDAQKKQAFFNEALRQGEAALAATGKEVDSSQDSLDRLNTSFENLNARLGEAALAFTPIIEGTTKFVNAISSDAVKTGLKLIINIGLAFAGLKAITLTTRVALGLFSKAIARNISFITTGIAQTKTFAQSMLALGKRFVNFVGPVKTAALAIGTFITAAQEFIFGTDEAKESVDRFSNAFVLANPNFEHFNFVLDDTLPKLETAAVKFDRLEKSASFYTDALLRLGPAEKNLGDITDAVNEIQQEKLNMYSAVAKASAALVAVDGKNALQSARLQQLAAIIDTYAAATKVVGNPYKMAAVIAAGLANVATIESSIGKMSSVAGAGAGGTYGKFEQGGYVGGRPHSQGGTIIEAERGEFVMSRNAVESIGLETLNQMNQTGGGGNINVSVTGNVLTQDFVEGELAESIKEAVRRGSDFGIG